MTISSDAITDFCVKHQVCQGSVAAAELHPETGAIEITPAVEIDDGWKIEMRCKGCGSSSSFTMTAEDIKRFAKEERADALARALDPEKALELLLADDWKAHLRVWLKRSYAVRQQILESYKKKG